MFHCLESENRFFFFLNLVDHLNGRKVTLANVTARLRGVVFICVVIKSKLKHHHVRRNRKLKDSGDDRGAKSKFFVREINLLREIFSFSSVR